MIIILLLRLYLKSLTTYLNLRLNVIKIIEDSILHNIYLVKENVLLKHWISKYSNVYHVPKTGFKCWYL